jgi:outer membrane protein assembly factor BamB
MMIEPVIDLGVVQDRVEEPPPPAPRPPRERTRRWLVAVITAATLLATGAAAAPAPPRLQRVFAAAAAADTNYVLTADTLNLNQPDSVGGSAITAFRLADGARRWTATFEQQAMWLQAVEADGSLIVQLVDGAVAAVDDTTGAVRWWSTGEPYTWSADGLLLVDSDDDGRVTGIRGADLRTGRATWSLAVDPPALGVITADRFDPARRPPSAGPLYLVQADGSTTIRRWSDGVELGRGRLDVSVPDENGDRGGVYVTADALYVVRADDTTTLTAYDLRTLAVRWRRPVPGLFSVTDCAAVLCLSTDAGVRAVDPTTGDPVWETPGWIGPWHAEGDHYVVDSVAQQSRALLDGRSGKVRPLLPWEPAGGSGPWLIRTATNPDALPPDARSIVALLDDGTPRLLGSVERIDAEFCRATATHLACVTGTGELTVWRPGRR